MVLHKETHICLGILVIKIVLLGIIIFGIITDKGFKIDRIIGNPFRTRGDNRGRRIRLMRTEIFHRIVVFKTEIKMKGFQIGISLGTVALMHQIKIYTRNKDFLVRGIHLIKEIMLIVEILMVIGGIFKIIIHIEITNQDVIIF